MLSARERQVLWEIEQRLSSEESWLAHLLARDMSPRSPRLTRCAHDVTWCRALLATLCMALSARGAGWWPHCSPARCWRFGSARFRTGRAASSYGCPTPEARCSGQRNSGRPRLRDRCPRRELSGRRETAHDNG